jgi:hypothetical protein
VAYSPFYHQSQRAATQLSLRYLQRIDVNLRRIAAIVGHENVAGGDHRNTSE